MNNLLSIDPGLHGAWVLWVGGKIKDVRQWESEEKTLDWLRGQNIWFAVIEDISCSLSRDIGAAAKLSQNYGFWRGILHAYAIKTSAIPATRWTRPFRRYGPTETYSQRKSTWLKAARALYPDDPRVNSYTADAILLGGWALTLDKLRSQESPLAP